MKRIWIVNNYAGNPKRGMQFRQYYLARSLNKLGYETWVISSNFHHLLTSRPDPGLSNENGVDFLWIKSSSYSGHGFGRIKNMLQFSTKYPIEGLKTLPVPDVIIASSPHLFVLPPALILKRLKKIKVIFEVRDIWPLSLVELMNVPTYHPLVLTFSQIEKMGYKYSDAIVSLIPGALEYMQEKGLTPTKFFYIPNGLPEEIINLYENPSVFNLTQKEKEILNEIKTWKGNCKYLFVFTGTIGLGTGVENLLKGFHEYLKSSNNSNACLLIVGDGVLYRSLKEKFGIIPRIKFTGRVSPSLIPHILKISTIAYAGWPNKKIYEMGGSPNKIFDYMAARLPILFSAPVRDEYNIIKQAKCGVTVRPSNIEEIVNGIKTFLNQPPSKIKEMGDNGFQYLTSRHTYSILAQEYMDVIEKR